VNPKSTSNQSSKPCTVLQYPSRNIIGKKVNFPKVAVGMDSGWKRVERQACEAQKRSQGQECKAANRRAPLECCVAQRAVPLKEAAKKSGVLVIYDRAHHASRLPFLPAAAITSDTEDLVWPCSPMARWKSLNSCSVTGDAPLAIASREVVRWENPVVHTTRTPPISVLSLILPCTHS